MIFKPGDLVEIDPTCPLNNDRQLFANNLIRNRIYTVIRSDGEFTRVDNGNPEGPYTQRFRLAANSYDPSQAGDKDDDI